MTDDADARLAIAQGILAQAKERERRAVESLASAQAEHERLKERMEEDTEQFLRMMRKVLPWHRQEDK